MKKSIFILAAVALLAMVRAATTKLRRIRIKKAPQQWL